MASATRSWTVARDARPYLELDVFEANTIGRRFYDAYGFTIVGRHIHEASGQPQLRLRFEQHGPSQRAHVG